MTLGQLLCVSGCVKRKVREHYDATVRTILEKVSVHSIVRDSFRLEKLSKLTLDEANYRKFNKYTHVSIGDLMKSD